MADAHRPTPRAAKASTLVWGGRPVGYEAEHDLVFRARASTLNSAASERRYQSGQSNR
jgi:hypothetical protein